MYAGKPVLQEHQAVLGRQPAAPAALAGARASAGAGRSAGTRSGRPRRTSGGGGCGGPSPGTAAASPTAPGRPRPARRTGSRIPLAIMWPQHAVHRPLPVELVEDQPDDVLGLLVGVERDLPGRLLDVPGRDADDQLPAAGLVQLALVHPLLEDVQLRLVHHPGQPQQEAIRVLGRVVHPVGVGEQDAEAGAQLEEVVPVLARAGQPAHLQPEDQPDPVQGDLGEQPLEARAGPRSTGRSCPGRRRSPGLATAASPRATARSARAYWRAVDSWWSRTCCGVDCRT